MRDDDKCRCVVIFREKKSAEWKLTCITERKSVAWKWAHAVQHQERTLLNHPKFETAVMTEKDFDACKMNRRLKAPPDFNYEISEPETNQCSPTNTQDQPQATSPSSHS